MPMFSAFTSIEVGYKHTVNDKFALFGEFGPYFACGLFGKTSSNALDYALL